MEKMNKGDKPPFFRNNFHGKPTSKDPKMLEAMGKRPRQKPMKCWGCEGDHMYIYCHHKGEKVMTIHNVQQNDTMEDMDINVSRIRTSLDNKQVEFESHMIEVEGKIKNKPIAILIDLGASHSYLDTNMVEKFQFPKRNLGKPWLVQLATRAKMKINEMVKTCPMDMNGMSTKEDLNIIPLGSYLNIFE
jgi:hypothetical protein